MLKDAALLLSSLVFAGAVAAQSELSALSELPAAGDAAPFFAELPVVLSASRLAQSLADAPSSVTVIDAEMIRTSGARDLADLLRMVPGFQVAQSTGGAPIAVYHGMTDANPRGLQILVDGRSQYRTILFGGGSWNLFDVLLDDIERIEVVRGANSAVYGSNAFLGVVNVVTRPAADAPLLAARLGQGSEGVADRQARLGWRIGAAAVRFSAERQQDDGVADFNDTRRNDRVNLRLDWPLSKASEFQFQAGGVDLALHQGQPGDLREPPRVIGTRKNFVSLALLHHGAAGNEAQLRYTHTSERYNDQFMASDPALNAFTASRGLPSPYLVKIDQRINTRRDELEFEHALVPLDDFRLVWGAGGRSDRVMGEQLYGTSEVLQQNVARLFVNLEWHSVSWAFNIGGTREHDSISGPATAPRLALAYHLDAQQTVRYGATRAHRLPTLVESRARTAYGTFDTGLIGLSAGVVPVEVTRFASGNLRREQIDVHELAYLGDFRPQRLFVDIRAFHEKVSERISTATLALSAPNCDLLGLLRRGCGTATDFLNGQNLVIRGVEAQLRWSPRLSTELIANQTFVSIVAQANGQFVARDPVAAQAADQHMNNSAPKTATMLRWRERLPFGLEASIAHYRYGRYQWTTDSAVGPSKRTDLQLMSPLRLGAARGDVALTVQGVGAQHAEFKESAVGTAKVTPEYLHPRVWLSVTVGI